MLRERGGSILETPNLGRAVYVRVYTCGYRDSMTRAEVKFDVRGLNGDSKTVTLDVALGGLEIGMSKATQKIMRAMTKYQELVLAQEIAARQDAFFDSLRKPAVPRHKKTNYSW